MDHYKDGTAAWIVVLVLFLSCDEGDGDALVTHVVLEPAIINYCDGLRINTEWGLVILG